MFQQIQNEYRMKPRISIMKMYDPNEDGHSYMDMEMSPYMYWNLTRRKKRNKDN